MSHGAAPCPACERTAGFMPIAKRRAFACRDCGFSLYPCEGTPFARAKPPLRHWFYAIYLKASGRPCGPRDLVRAFGCSQAAAEPLAQRVATMEHERADHPGETDWFSTISGFVTEHVAGAVPTMTPERRETAWSTLLSLLPSAEIARYRYFGLSLIAGLAAVAIGVGLLMVPDEPVEDPELTQATAILALADDSAVIVVSPEVAEQLYDVSDADPAPSALPVPVIRTAPAGVELKRITVSEARPLSRPSVKLAQGVGDSILKGDLASARRRAEARPELAAYASLAIALDTKGPANPDEVLTFGPMRIRRYLVDKIVRAARVTSMDPVLLMAIADKESSFATEVQAQTSSATGLFQFIEKTWLGVVRDFGSTYGLEREAQLVAGDLSSAERSRILALRSDAYLSAVLAAEMLKRDGNRLARVLGRPLTGGETYLVHFLGPDGAQRLLTRAVAAPDAAAAELLPRPAAANQPIFYASGSDGTRRSLSVSVVRDKFETMIGMRLNRYRSVHSVGQPEPAPTAGPPRQTASE